VSVLLIAWSARRTWLLATAGRVWTPGGSIRLGMTQKEVEWVLGPPSSSFAMPKKGELWLRGVPPIPPIPHRPYRAFWTFSEGFGWVDFDEQGRATGVTFCGPRPPKSTYRERLLLLLDW